MTLPVFSPITQITLPDFPSHPIAIKRDDLIDTLISGNKWRKLKYTLAQAQNQQKNHLVSFGGAYSNHLLALASAGAKFQYQTTAFVRGEEVANPLLGFCKLLGMRLIFVDRTVYKDKQALFDQYFASDAQAFFIDEGGASPEGIQGCTEIIAELPQYYQHVFCASGTGTTAQGLLQGIVNQNINTQLHCIPVLKNAAEIADKLAQIYPHQYVVHPHFDAGGYAKTTPELLIFIQKFIAHTGILIDPVYTGKMFFALYQLLQQSYFSPHESILALHTGGVFGILGMMDKFKDNG